MTSVCGKRTIPVILGIRGAKIYHFVITLLAVICLVLYSMLHSAGWTGYLFVNATVAGNASEVSLSGRRKSFGFSIEISFHNDIADSAFIRFCQLLSY